MFPTQRIRWWWVYTSNSSPTQVEGSTNTGGNGAAQPNGVALYTRVATREQMYDAQGAQLLGYCELKGWSNHRAFRDDGISEIHGNRPALDELRARMKR